MMLDLPDATIENRLDYHRDREEFFYKLDQAFKLMVAFIATVLHYFAWQGGSNIILTLILLIVASMALFLNFYDSSRQHANAAARLERVMFINERLEDHYEKRRNESEI